MVRSPFSDCRRSSLCPSIEGRASPRQPSLQGTRLPVRGLPSDSVIFAYHVRSEPSECLFAEKGLLAFIRRAMCQYAWGAHSNVKREFFRKEVFFAFALSPPLRYCFDAKAALAGASQP